jgi:hypothetical protein
MVNFDNDCGYNSKSGQLCADHFEHDAYSNKATKTKTSIGTFAVNASFNQITLNSGIDLINSDLIYVSGPVAADMETETLFSDIHDTCDTCVTCSCSTPVYCQDECDSKSLNHRRALIRFGVETINDRTFLANGSVFNTTKYRDVYEFSVNLSTTDRLIKYPSTTSYLITIDPSNCKYLNKNSFLFFIQFNESSIFEKPQF